MDIGLCPVNVVGAMVSKGSVFFCNVSGGLMLANSASGPLIVFVKSHITTWDWLAGRSLKR